MFGTFQQSNLRIEVNASEQQIRETLLCPGQFQRWLQPQRFSAGMPDRLESGVIFTSWLGPIAVRHCVDRVTPQGARLILSEGIDGAHEWLWGEGWVQSRLEGISILPLNLGQTLTLLRLKQFLNSQKASI